MRFSYWIKIKNEYGNHVYITRNEEERPQITGPKSSKDMKQQLIKRYRKI